jgi:four helix bundle protein
MRENIIIDKSFNFSVRIINLYKYLCNNKNEYILSKQILKSGTSVGANIEEAHGGVSKADFLSKISIAYKESRETSYWLRLLNKTGFISQKMFNSIYNDCEELSKILYTIIKTLRNKK